MWRALLFCSACSFTAQVNGDAPVPPLEVLPDTPPDAPERITDGLVALYTFKENGGNTLHDRSGKTPAMDATIADLGLVVWDAQSLSMNGSATASLIATPTPPASRRITDNITATNAVTVEVWVLSAEPSQTGTAGGADESARVVTLSASNPGGRNFAIGQRDTMWQGQLRTTFGTPTPDPQGNPPLRGGVVSQVFQHVVLTATSTVRTLYVDKVAVAADTTAVGTLANWDPGYRLSLGNEVSLNNKWKGKLLLLAIYNRALSREDIVYNYDRGF